MSPGAAEAGRIGRVTYAVPMAFALPAVYFNATLVKAAGGDPGNLPVSWEGIVDLARKIDALEGDAIGGFFEHDQGGNFTFLGLVESAGGRMMNEDETEIAFNGPEGLRALTIIRGFGKAGQARADMARDQARQAFAAGKIGVLVSSSSLVGRIQKNSGNAFEVKAMRFPVAPGGRLPAAGVAAVLFTDDPARQKAVMDYLRFAVSPAGQATIIRNITFIPANETVITDPETLGDFYAQNPVAARLAAGLPPLSAWYAFPGKNSGEIINVIKGYLRKAATLKATPEEIMADMTAEVKALLKE